jgi:hypothetical protein
MYDNTTMIQINDATNTMTANEVAHKPSSCSAAAQGRPLIAASQG